MSDMPPGSPDYERPPEMGTTRGPLTATLEWLKEKRILLWSACVASANAAIAVIGQISYYLTIPNLPTVIAYLFPMGIEATSWVFGAAAAYCVAKNLPSSKYTKRMWLFSLIAAAVNTWHGVLHINPAVGVVLGSASVIGPFVWHSYTGMARIQKSGKTFEEIKVEAKTRLLHPILSFRASRVQSLFQCDRATAWKWAVAFRMKDVKKKAREEQARKLQNASLPVMQIEKAAAADKQPARKPAATALDRSPSRRELPARPAQQLTANKQDAAPKSLESSDAAKKKEQAVQAWLARLDENGGKGPSYRSIDIELFGSDTSTTKKAVSEHIRKHGDPREKQEKPAVEGVAR